jgi:N-acetylglucosamine-6-sulfatase
MRPRLSSTGCVIEQTPPACHYSVMPVPPRLLPVVAVLAAGTLAIVGLAFAVRQGMSGPGGDGRPNIVLIVTDDQRWDTLNVMPNVLETIGERGVTFENAFVTTPLCCPSRASLLTGRYSRHTGVHGNGPPDGGAPAFEDTSTVATWLHDAGYSTSLVGKYLNGYRLLEEGYIPPGWDDWHATTGSPEISYYGHTLNENGSLVRFGSDPQDYSTTVLGDRAETFAREAAEPFFLYFAPIAPHLPARPAPGDAGTMSGLEPFRPPSFNEADVSDKPWAGRFPPLDEGRISSLDGARRRMLESLVAVDRSVAALIQTLQDRGVLDRTVVLFTSDNGTFWGEHRRDGKVWPYEEAIRVPLLVRGPGFPAGRTDTRLVLNIDLAPTLAELAGASDGPDPIDGMSLAPLPRGEEASAWRTSFVVEFLGPASLAYEGIRTEHRIWVEYANGGRELYDLTRDPYQLENLAGDPAFAAVRAELEGELDRLLAEQAG